MYFRHEILCYNNKQKINNSRTLLFHQRDGKGDSNTQKGEFNINREALRQDTKILRKRKKIMK